MNAYPGSVGGSNFAPASVSPLHQVKAGKAVRIRELCGSPEVSCRLREIGLGEGQIVRLIASHANIICQVCQARLALNATLARMIMVELLPE
ncbi:MAG TPA: FeoA family protein [Verrucomicrobiae bacterium]|nr:FeoA family protein [Verrucomicrobiae bacterium]